MQSIILSLNRNTLDYIWIARDILQKQKANADANVDSIKNKFFNAISNASFEYYDKYSDSIHSDPSLNAITSMCDMTELSEDVTLEDKEVTFLSHIFNHIVLSDRKLHKCYDCGTNARAMFLKLVKLHRGGKLYLTPREQIAMEGYIALPGEKGIAAMKECAKHLKQSPSDAVYICSIGVEKFGHVWIFEKITTRTGKQIVRHYQSALKSHLVLDFIADMDYGQFPEKDLDLDQFFQKLESLLLIETEWTEKNYRDFNQLFAFNPVRKVTEPRPNFCWTYVIY